MPFLRRRAIHRGRRCRHRRHRRHHRQHCLQHKRTAHGWSMVSCVHDGHIYNSIHQIDKSRGTSLAGLHSSPHKRIRWEAKWNGIDAATVNWLRCVAEGLSCASFFISFINGRPNEHVYVLFGSVRAHNVHNVPFHRRRNLLLCRPTIIGIEEQKT